MGKASIPEPRSGLWGQIRQEKNAGTYEDHGPDDWETIFQRLMQGFAGVIVREFRAGAPPEKLMFAIGDIETNGDLGSYADDVYEHELGRVLGALEREATAPPARKRGPWARLRRLAR